jgi:6-phosphofructokinase 1
VSQPRPPRNIAVLTSGGDAPGMNPAVRAVGRTPLHPGIHPERTGGTGLPRDQSEY